MSWIQCDVVFLLYLFVPFIPSGAWSRTSHSAGTLSPWILMRSLSNSRPQSAQSNLGLYWYGNWKGSGEIQNSSQGRRGLSCQKNHIKHIVRVWNEWRWHTIISQLHKDVPLFAVSQPDGASACNWLSFFFYSKKGTGMRTSLDYKFSQAASWSSGSVIIFRPTRPTHPTPQN